MAIKDTDAFLDSLIQELQAMKEDPEKDTLARVIGMVLRVANQHNDRSELKKSFIIAAMGFDGIDPYEYEVLKRWEAEEK